MFMFHDNTTVHLPVAQTVECGATNNSQVIGSIASW